MEIIVQTWLVEMRHAGVRFIPNKPTVTFFKKWRRDTVAHLEMSAVCNGGRDGRSVSTHQAVCPAAGSQQCQKEAQNRFTLSLQKKGTLPAC